MLPAQLPEKPAPVSVFGVGSSVAEAPTAEQMSPRSGRGSVGPSGTGSTGSRGPVWSVAAPCGSLGAPALHPQTATGLIRP